MNRDSYMSLQNKRNNIENIMDLSKVDGNCNNILHFMAMNNDVECMPLLFDCLNNKIKSKKEKYKIINQQNNDGDTPMHIAVKLNNKEIANLLYNNGANLCIENNENKVVQFDPSMNNKQYNLNNNDKYTQIYGLHTNNQFEKQNLFNNNNNIENLIKNRYNKPMEVSIELESDITTIDYEKNNEEDDEELSNSEVSQFINSEKMQSLLKEAINNKAMLSGGGKEKKQKTHKKDKNEDKPEKKSHHKKNEDDPEKKSHRKKNEDDPEKKSHRKKKHMSKSKQESQENHDQTIKKIIDLGYSPEDAYYLKAALYKYTKDKFADLSSFEKSKKMLELAVKKNIGGFDLEQLKKDIPKKKERN